MLIPYNQSPKQYVLTCWSFSWCIQDSWDDKDGYDDTGLGPSKNGLAKSE